jgi:hypothetical protein
VTAVLVNVTLTETTGSGYVAVFPAGTLWPGTSTVNWWGPGQSVANAITVMHGNNKLTLRAGVGTTHVVLDLYGYHR